MDELVGRIRISPEDLNLTHTLTPGQSFRWRKDRHNVWTGVVQGRIIRIWREGEDVAFSMYPGVPDEDLIRDYFRLEVDLQEVYRSFIAADPRLEPAIERFRGLRVLRQEPEEALLSYICSTWNSVKKIIRSVEQMSRQYGRFIANVDGHDYYAFPTARALTEADILDMAGTCGLGFRCENLCSVAHQVLERSIEWLDGLRLEDYETARAQLLEVKGVGLKIADCVLLFSLDKDEAFPVDTHVRQMAVKHYLPEFKQKTMTPAVYNTIVKYFQDKFGPYAGWAQEYLFYDDMLGSFYASN